MLSAIGSTIAPGLAFGTGSAVVHKVVDDVIGPRTIQHETVASEAAPPPAHAANRMGGADACNIHFRAFQDGFVQYHMHLHLYLCEDQSMDSCKIKYRRNFKGCGRSKEKVQNLAACDEK